MRRITRHSTSRLLLLLPFSSHCFPTPPSSHRLHSLQAPTFPLPSPQSIPETACLLVSRAYEDGDRKLRSFQMEITQEQALCIVSLLAEREGSMVALSFFHWAIARSEFRHFMRLFLTTASSLVLRGNLEKAREVMRCMVMCFSEIGRYTEAVDMILEMRNQGLPLDVHIMNYILRVAVELGFIDHAHQLFDVMPLHGILPDFVTFKTMVAGYCNAGRVSDVETLLILVESRGFRIDNVTCTRIVEAFCKKGWHGKVFGVFSKMLDMGLPPNVINYTALIDGLCKRGSVKQAFQVLEEMVGKGMKPNVYTHTTLIDGLCKIGWTERAFRLFLKLVRSESYKPNTFTYTAMIAGYCKERKLGRAEMLLARMQEQGLTPNVNTYNTLIDGYCKEGNIEQARGLINIMTKEGCIPNICTYNAVIDGLCNKGRVEEAYRLVKAARQRGLLLDKVSYTILICNHCKQGQTEAGSRIVQSNGQGRLFPWYTYIYYIDFFVLQAKENGREREVI
ncbi:HCP-like protein [Dioscorea alata]|uniref:HCP-like protein n=1 Tax=Dioscorea alata TaxID=55571 RepID=A0ACB7U7B2_DIOAL|nr:HCP-like protein [Dioscorea alata]